MIGKCPPNDASTTFYVQTQPPRRCGNVALGYNRGMNTPMVGSWSVTVRGVRPFMIHGDLYYELHVVRDDVPDQLLSLKVPQHATSVEPQAGQRLTVTFLMGQVTGAKAT